MYIAAFCGCAKSVAVMRVSAGNAQWGHLLHFYGRDCTIPHEFTN